MPRAKRPAPKLHSLEPLAITLPDGTRAEGEVEISSGPGVRMRITIADLVGPGEVKRPASTKPPGKRRARP